MKTRFTLFGIFAVMLFAISICFIGCQENVNDVVTYRGEVVYINTTTPFADLTVKVTDGKNTHCQTLTDAAGLFSLKVRVNEIDGNYYLLAGDSTCIPKKVALGGYGQAEVDLGTIEVEGPALPTVVTKTIQSVTADAAVIGGEVQTDGRLSVTARGICYGTETYPTVDGLRTTDGTGIGEFTSNLKNLQHNTIYYARAYATNRMGTAYGEQVKFTTEEGVAIVVTDSIIRITAHSARCKGHVESDGGYPVTKRGTCWSKQPDPTIDDFCTNDGSGLGEFTSGMNDLIENTTYYVRTYATNSTSTTYGEQFIITTLDGLAVVTTDSITSVTATGFSAYGTVVSDCDIPVTARGFCYATTQEPTIEGKHTTIGKGLGSFYSAISGLEYATTYYVRAYATNATETVYGKQFEITTLSGLPTVTTDSVSNIGSVKATCGGEVTDDGSLTVTARGVCYGTSQWPTIEDAHTTDGRGKGQFTSNLKNLQDKTTYYVRAYATTDAGIAYGGQRVFRTEDGIPVVVISQLDTPTANSITCEGNVTGDGGVSVTERGFCYSTSQYPTNTDTHIAIGNGTGSFSGSLTNLSINTTYYIRAYAVNSIGVGYSAQQSFTTLDGMPVVTTGQPTATATTINVGGEVTDNGGYTVTERGVCYSTIISEPTIADSKVVSGRGNGIFTAAISGLAASTTYYLRAYAINENGTAYGETQTIVTSNGAAFVSIGTMTNIAALTATGSVTVSDAGGATLQSCGICWSTVQNPTISDNTTTGGNQLNTSYICNMTGLIPATTYYVRAYATTDITTSYSSQVTFQTTTGLPDVATGSAISKATSLTISGEVIANGGYSVTERGFCYSNTNSEPTLADTKTRSGSGNGSYSASIAPLDVATIYYVRAYATNSIGTAYGNIVTISTTNGSATVTTNAITNIKALTATGGVNVTDAGGATLQSCGICWSTNPNPTINNTKAIGGNQLNTTYNCNLTELTPNTTYYVRAYATTNITTTYGSEVSFKTTKGTPEITLSPLSNVLTKSFLANANVTSDGGYSVTSRGFCWSSTNTTPNMSDSHIEVGTGTGSFSQMISNLQANTTYYICAYATNSIGTVYSDIITQITGNGLQGVHFGLNPISNITATSVTCRVIVDYNYSDVPIISEGCCWSSTTTTPTINDATTNDGQATTSYSSILTNLSPSTTYYVRAYITTSYGTSYSPTYETITTTNGLPTVVITQFDYTSTTNTSLLCKANVISEGDAIVSERGFCWSTSGSPTINDVHGSSGARSGQYTYTISGIDPFTTTYYIRAYAKNTYGIAYSDVIIHDMANPYNLPIVNVQGTKYMIYPVDLGLYSRSGAITLCQGLSQYGFSDWRLPSTTEISTITNYGGIFYFTENVAYWTTSFSQNIYNGIVTWYAFRYSTDTSGTTTVSPVSTTSEYSKYNVRPIRSY